VFDQYLRDVRIPKFEHRLDGNKLMYRWSNSVEGFAMPLKVYIDGKEKWLEPTANWQELKVASRKAKLEVDRNFYVTAAKAASS
jgi:hypothetical protein